MNSSNKICFTCRKSDCNKFYSVHNYDIDKMSYFEKLKLCVTDDLIEDGEMLMCWLCIKHLRASYKFRLTVLMSQELLRKNDMAAALIKKEEDYVDIKPFINTTDDSLLKSESASDMECYDRSDSYSHDLPIDTKVDNLKTRKYDRKITGESTATCEYCGIQFGKLWQLKKHIVRVHNELRKFVCTYCNKEFKQSYHLKEHITSHTGEKNYTCSICDKKFQRLSSLSRHLKTHDAPPGHKTKRTPFLCTICGKSFPFSNGVQRHLRIHTGVKKFECNVCGRRFTQSTHLQVHMRTHTGEKPYICDTCGEKFSLKSCMLKHINSRHYRSKNLVEELPIFYLHKEFERS